MKLLSCSIATVLIFSFVAYSTTCVAEEKDQYIHEFASSQHYNHDKIKASGSTLKLKYDVSTTPGILVTGAGIFGAVWTAIQYASNNLSGYDALVCAVGSVAATGFGRLLYDYLRSFHGKTYLKFNPTELRVADRASISWKDLDKVKRAKDVSYYHHSSNHPSSYSSYNYTHGYISKHIEHKVLFRNKFGNTFTLSGNSLPVSLDSVVALAKHYKKNYGENS